MSYILRFQPNGTSVDSFQTLAEAVKVMNACVQKGAPAHYSRSLYRGYAEVSNESGELVFAQVNALGELRPAGLGPLEVTYTPEFYSKSGAWLQLNQGSYAEDQYQQAKNAAVSAIDTMPVRVVEHRARSRVVYERASN